MLLCICCLSNFCVRVDAVPIVVYVGMSMMLFLALCIPQMDWKVCLLLIRQPEICLVLGTRCYSLHSDGEQKKCTPLEGKMIPTFCVYLNLLIFATESILDIFPLFSSSSQ